MGSDRPWPATQGCALVWRERPPRWPRVRRPLALSSRSHPTARPHSAQRKVPVVSTESKEPCPLPRDSEQPAAPGGHRWCGQVRRAEPRDRRPGGGAEPGGARLRGGGRLAQRAAGGAAGATPRAPGTAGRAALRHAQTPHPFDRAPPCEHLGPPVCGRLRPFPSAERPAPCPAAPAVRGRTLQSPAVRAEQ